jgi:TonB family protein
VFTIVGVAVNEPSDQGWRDYIEKNKMTWPQYLDSSRKIAALFKVNSYPTYITIDADGIIRDRRTGWNAETMSYIDDHVRKAMKAREKAGPPALKIPERSTPSPNVPTTQANPTPVQPVPRIVEPLGAIPVAGVVGGVVGGISPPPTPPVPINTNTSGGVSVRGRVTRLPGAPSALRANLILPGTQPVTTSAVVGPDGSFEFVNIRPGTYNVSLSVPVPFRQIVVGSLDMTGIEFTVPPMRTITGRAVIEGGGALPQRLVFVVPHQVGSVTMSTLIQPDGSFNILLPEGERRLSTNAPPGYSVRSFMHGSTDLLRDSFKLSNTDTSQLVVTLTPGGTTPPSLVPGPRGAPVALATLPVLISRVEPQYTDQARQAQLQGMVRVQAIVRKDGSVDSVQVIQGLGMGLDEAAVAAVRQWRFRPATREGEVVDYPITLSVNFNLRQ